MPFLMYGLAPGFSDDAGEVRPRRAADAHHHALPAVHVAGGAAVGRAQLVRQVRRKLVGLHRAQRHDDGGDAHRACGSAISNEPMAGVIQAWGVFAAGILQLCCCSTALRRNGICAQAALAAHDRRHAPPDPLGIPGIIAGGVTQINIVIGTVIASMQNGAVSYLYYADRALRAAARHRRHRHRRGAAARRVAPPARRQPRSGHGQPEPLARVRHAADACRRPWRWPWCRPPSSPACSSAAPSRRPTRRPPPTRWRSSRSACRAFVLIKVFSPAYFAREDTRTPMRLRDHQPDGEHARLDRAVLPVPRLGWMPHLGIAVATTLGGWLNAGLLYATLAKRGVLRRRRAPQARAAAHPAGQRHHGCRAVGSSPPRSTAWFKPPTSELVRAGALRCSSAPASSPMRSRCLRRGRSTCARLRAFLSRRTPPPGPL